MTLASFAPLREIFLKEEGFFNAEYAEGAEKVKGFLFVLIRVDSWFQFFRFLSLSILLSL